MMIGSKVLFCLFVMSTIVCSGGCHNSVPPPEYRLNTSPDHDYMITVKSNRSISSNVYVEVQYHIINSECIPIDYTKALGGIRLDPKVMIRIMPVRDNGKDIHFTLAQNKVLPFDYWGKGVCHWGIEGLAVYVWHLDRYFELWLAGARFPYRVKFSCNYKPKIDKRLGSCVPVGKKNPANIVIMKTSFVYILIARRMSHE